MYSPTPKPSRPRYINLLFFTTALFSQVPVQAYQKSSSSQQPWSPRVTKIIKKNLYHFKSIHYSYPFKYQLSELILPILATITLPFASFLLFLRPLFWKKTILKYTLIRIGISLILILSSLIYYLYTRSFYTDPGFFFLTDKGLLIIYPGKTRKHLWIPYQHIDRVAVSSFPKNQPPTKYLVIIDKGGHKRHFASQRFPSLFVFQECYLRLQDKCPKSP